MTEQIVDVKQAKDALARVDTLAEKLGRAEQLLEAGYAEFAEALLVVQDNLYWKTDMDPATGDPFESWGSYMRHVTETFKLGQRQLYHKIAVVKELRGVVPLEDLTEMGISKASVLADTHKIAPVTDEMIETAKSDATAKELKQRIAETLHLPEDEGMEWIDLGYAFFVSAEEKQEIRDAEEAARMQDPVVSNTIKESTQRKEVFLRFCREFLATYGKQE